MLLNKCSVPLSKQDLPTYLWRQDIILDSHPPNRQFWWLRTLEAMLAEIEIALDKLTCLTGPEYGLADAALTPFVSRSNELGFEWIWDDLSHLGSCSRKIQKRDSFRAVFDALPNPARRRGISQAGEEVHHEAIKILKKNEKDRG